MPLSEQKIIYKLIVERMNTIENLRDSIDFNNLSYHDKGPTANVIFNNFIDRVTLFDEIKSSRIKLDDKKKKRILNRNSKIRIEKKVDMQGNAIKNIMKLYNAEDYVIKFFEDYFTMINNNTYDATHGLGLKTLNCQ